MSKSSFLVAGALSLAAASVAHAELSVEGRAVGSALTVLGTDVEILRTGDTGTRTSTAPGGFDHSVSGATLEVPGVARVVTSAARTTGEADDAREDNLSFVTTTVGNSAAVVLPDDPLPVLDSVVSGSEMELTCDGASGSSRLELLYVAGTPVLTAPGEVPANTTILSPDLPLVTLNEQRLEVDPVSRTASFTVNALHADFAADLDLAELVLASASGAIRDVPADVACPIVEPPFSLLNSRKIAEHAHDADGDGLVEAGDRLRYRIVVESSGSEAAPSVRVVDRLPREIDVDPDSVTAGGEPVPGAVGDCPADARFDLCRNEPSEECLIVNVGDVTPGAENAVEVVFEAVVRNEAIGAGGEGETCNTVLVGPIERQALVDLGDPGFDEPPLNPDPLLTTGSGGCAIGGPAGGAAGEAWLVLAWSALVARLRRRRAAK